MDNHLKRIWKQLAAAVLGVFGFASCVKEGKEVIIDDFPEMYGVPYADFKVLGSISDQAGDPIEGIRVAITRHNHYESTPYVIYPQSDLYEYDTLFTDSKGLFQMKKELFEAPDDATRVFEDVDGEEHGGEFESIETAPAITQVKKGDNEWYFGAYEVDAKVVMKKK